MENKIRRPPSVWIAQLLLLGLALLLALPTLMGLVVLPTLLQDMDLFQLLFAFVINPTIVIVYVFCFWSLAKRKPCSRRLSAGVLVLSFGFLALVVVFGLPSVVVLPAVGSFIFLVYRLAFGSAANAFFAKPTSGE